MPDETSRPEYEQLREDLRRDLRDDLRNLVHDEVRDGIRSAMAGLGEAPGSAEPSKLGVFWPHGPVCFPCWVIIAVPVCNPEHEAMTRFARLGEEGPER